MARASKKQKTNNNENMIPPVELPLPDVGSELRPTGCGPMADVLLHPSKVVNIETADGRFYVLAECVCPLHDDDKTSWTTRDSIPGFD